MKKDHKGRLRRILKELSLGRSKRQFYESVTRDISVREADKLVAALGEAPPTPLKQQKEYWTGGRDHANSVIFFDHNYLHKESTPQSLEGEVGSIDNIEFWCNIDRTKFFENREEF